MSDTRAGWYKRPVPPLEKSSVEKLLGKKPCGRICLREKLQMTAKTSVLVVLGLVAAASTRASSRLGAEVAPPETPNKAAPPEVSIAVAPPEVPVVVAPPKVPVAVAPPEDEAAVSYGFPSFNDTVESHDNFDERGPYYGGDMILNEDQLEDFKQGIIGSSYRWPGGRIPYVLDSYFTSTERSTISSGMDLIQSQTCIRFYPRTNEAQYIYIQRGASGTGCYSEVGRQTSTYNVVNLQYNGCVTAGITAHELIHAIGFYHEQSRPDRDDYVSINWSNIQSGRAYNFDKFTTSQVTQPAAYDYDSIMHYSAYSFAINMNTPTIYPRQNIAYSRIGQRTKLSPLDAQKINALYSGIC